MRSAASKLEQHAEFASAALLAVAGLATSWSTYQAAQWGGKQATLYSVASDLRVDSTRAHESADHLYTIDIGLFSSWVDARGAANGPLQDFYRRRFRAEFKPAFEAWLASEVPPNGGGASTPFSLPMYRLAEQVRSTELERKSESIFREGQLASDRSSAYVLNGVLFASVLFFSGIAQQFKVLRAQLVLLGLAAAMLAIGLCSMSMLPQL
jgi:hypothetical protein